MSSRIDKKEKTNSLYPLLEKKWRSKAKTDQSWSDSDRRESAMKGLWADRFSEECLQCFEFAGKLTVDFRNILDMCICTWLVSSYSTLLNVCESNSDQLAWHTQLKERDILAERFQYIQYISPMCPFGPIDSKHSKTDNPCKGQSINIHDEQVKMITWPKVKKILWYCCHWTVETGLTKFLEVFKARCMHLCVATWLVYKCILSTKKCHFFTLKFV